MTSNANSFATQKDPERALSIAVKMEMGQQNQQRISSNSNNSAAGITVNAIQSFNRFCGAGGRGNQSGRVAVNRATIGQCRGCGQAWSTTHRQVCPALGKKCSNISQTFQYAQTFRQGMSKEIK